MIFTPAPDLISVVVEAGVLELFSATRGKSVHLHGAPIAMWIALRQYDGRLDEAAQHLAALWQEDPATVFEEMRHWAQGLCVAGLLTASVATPADRS
jgi:hypothetical protein